jgi:hypothetical protein
MWGKVAQPFILFWDGMNKFINWQKGNLIYFQYRLHMVFMSGMFFGGKIYE